MPTQQHRDPSVGGRSRDQRAGPPAVRLVHPLDLADARRPFVVSELASTMAFPVAAGLGVLLWFLAEPPIVGLIVGALVLAAGVGVSRWLARNAWSAIRSDRQDRDRRPPLGLDLVTAVAFAATFGGLTCVFVWGVYNSDLAGSTKLWLLGGLGVAFGIRVIELSRVVISAVRRQGALRTVPLEVIRLASFAIPVLYGGWLVRHVDELRNPLVVETVLVIVVLGGIELTAWIRRAVARRRAGTDTGLGPDVEPPRRIPRLLSVRRSPVDQYVRRAPW